MKITLDEVRRIAHLAHLQFSEEEVERLRGQLDQILVYIDKLDELRTDGVEEAAGAAFGPAAPLRDDTATASLPVEEALSNAPESGRGHFKVPKIIP